MKGFLPALGIVGYIVLFTFFITSFTKAMPGPDPAWAPLVFLTMFCFSALTCVLIVFYKPYMLMVEKKGREAGELVLATTKWLGLALTIIVVAVILIR